MSIITIRNNNAYTSAFINEVLSMGRDKKDYFMLPQPLNFKNLLTNERVLFYSDVSPFSIFLNMLLQFDLNWITDLIDALADKGWTYYQEAYFFIDKDALHISCSGSSGFEHQAIRSVELTFIQEIVADYLKVNAGQQYITNLMPIVQMPVEHMDDKTCPYDDEEVKSFPVITSPLNIWVEDLKMFIDEGQNCKNLRERFFRRVAIPILMAHESYELKKDPDIAIKILKDCKATDWRKACIDWLNGEDARHAKAHADREKEESEKKKKESSTPTKT